MSPDSIAAILAGFILLLVHASPWMAQDSPALVRNPAKLVAGISGAQVIPHYFVVIFRPEESMIYSLLGGDMGALLTKFAIFYSIGMAALLFGLKIGSGRWREQIPVKLNYEPNYYFFSLFAFFVYILSMYFIIAQNFGFSEFISGAGTQRQLESGTGFLYIFKTPASYLAILFIAVQHARTGNPKFWMVICYVVLIVLIESTLGSRRTPIQLILFAVIAIHMVRPDRSLFSTSNILLGLFCITIFVLLLNFRYSSKGMEGPETIASYIVNFSYNDIYMFIMHHFSYYDYWYGKVFLDFQYRFTGGIQGFGPPPIDEGVYIYNLFLGRPVEPPLPTELMATNSWPPRTFGNGYMNFGFWGIVFFNFIQGWMTGVTYRWMTKTGGHPIYIFIFLLMVFSFQVSNLKIAELLIVFVGLTVVFGPLYLIEMRSQREAKRLAVLDGWPQDVGLPAGGPGPRVRHPSQSISSALGKDDSN